MALSESDFEAMLGGSMDVLVSNSSQHARFPEDSTSNSQSRDYTLTSEPFSPNDSTANLHALLPPFQLGTGAQLSDSDDSDWDPTFTSSRWLDPFPNNATGYEIIRSEDDTTPEPALSTPRTMNMRMGGVATEAPFPDALPTAMLFGALPISPPLSAGTCNSSTALRTPATSSRAPPSPFKTPADTIEPTKTHSRVNSTSDKTCFNSADSEAQSIGTKRRREDVSERPDNPAFYHVGRPASSPQKKQKVTPPARTGAGSGTTKIQVKPPRGQLRYRDPPSKEASHKSKVVSKASASPSEGSTHSSASIPLPNRNYGAPVKIVSLNNIDRSKCMTTELILGYNPQSPPKGPVAISCAIEDEELNAPAKAAFDLTRARLAIKEDLVRPPENAITNVVTADMRPHQAREAMKWSRVAMREAKQTQAMLLYAMDMADRRRNAKVTFALPGEQVFSVLVGKSGSGDDGNKDEEGDGMRLGNTLLSSPPNKAGLGLVSALRGGRTQAAEPSSSSSRMDSGNSESSHGAWNGSLSSGRPSISSTESLDGFSSFPPAFNVAPPVPAYSFNMPSFPFQGNVVPNLDPLVGGSGADGGDGYVPVGMDSTSSHGIPWDMALQAQAASMLNSFQLPGTGMSVGETTLPVQITPSSSTATITDNTQQLELNQYLNMAPLSPTTLPTAMSDSFFPSSSLPIIPDQPGFLFNGGSDTSLPLHTDLMGQFSDRPSRQRAITATGIERLLGSATIADHNRTMPELSMNPCTLYPPGQLIAYEQWMQQQRFVGIIDAEPQLLPQGSSAPVQNLPGTGGASHMLNNLAPALPPPPANASIVPATPTASAPAQSLSAVAAGKRKSIEEPDESEGWTSAYPPPIPGGRGTKKRGRPRSRSDVPPKPKLSFSLSSASGESSQRRESSGTIEDSPPVMHGPELPPGVKKDVPIAAPSLVPLRICAPVARRGVGKSSGPTQSTSTRVERTSTGAIGGSSMMQHVPGIGLGDASSAASTPRPISSSTRVRAATTSALLNNSNVPLDSLPGTMDGPMFMPFSSPTSSTSPSSALLLPTYQPMLPGPWTSTPGPSSLFSGRRLVNNFGGQPTLAMTGASRRLSSSTWNSFTAGGLTMSGSESGGSGSTRPGTGNTSTSSSSSDLMFVNYGMEDANELRQAVAPSGNYKVPLQNKRKKADP
ncbi:hypothetical protein A4X09_0g3265 [Tilletia walkeri]|uniref:Uncharacterized protein n=1 Tax=Tilletia walkeri TaxID=117179 RepID=A0A8X7T5D6_9BASI|nr:hypothetical protein A4X09_0g3265 [Tilletia walkeri]